MVAFSILGPLEARRGDAALPVGQGKQRAVLTLLLLHAGRVVGVDALLDALWGEAPPPTAGKALQVHVSHLRRALGPGVIVTRAPGYLLAAAPEDVDAARFERLAAEGRAALEAGDARDAAGLLRAALALWRGPALADVAYEPWAQTEAARLEELRELATEDRVEADLALGRHAALVPELEQLVARAPGRERLREQQMLALYRCGRQGDALAAYRRARRALVEELGLEPGPRLQEIERAILEHDPALGAPAVAPDPPPAPPGAEERRLLSVLFADVEVDEDPEVGRTAQEDATAEIAAAVDAAGGRVERAASDGVVATFGAAVACEDHAERALAAASAIRDGANARVRVGVESGTALVGAAGTAGPVIAAAARLARSARPGDVAVGPRASAATAPARRRPGRAFVGRGDELRLLGDALTRVSRARRPHVVAVVGDAGVGKTSLLRAFRERTGDTRWHVGRCVAFGRATTFRPVADILAGRFGIAPDAPADDVRRALGDREILALAFGHVPAGAEDPWRTRERLREAWTDVLEELSAAGPAVLAVEDVHWAEDPLLELLAAAADAAGPLLVLVTGRPELTPRLPALGSARTVTQAWLEPLSREEAGELVDALAGDLGASRRGIVLDRVEGNPFFLEEVLQSLADTGSLQAPDSVQAVIAGRMDLLPAPAKAVLQAAAVVGRTFGAGDVRALVPDADPGALRMLEDRDFVRRAAARTAGDGRGYAFKHALTAEVAYASLPRARRAGLHAACGAWLEDRGAEPPVLAHHFAEAVEHLPGTDARREDLRARAITWLARAGELAFARSELKDAVALYHRAADLEADGAGRAELLRRAARASEDAFDLLTFRRDMERAIDATPDPRQAGLLYGELALEGARPYLWQRPPARADVERWIAAAETRSAPGTRAHGLALVARASLDPATSGRIARQAVRVAEAVGEPYLLRSALEVEAQGLIARGDLLAARPRLDRSIEIAARGGDPDQRAGSLFMASFAYARLGRFEDVRRFLALQAEVTARLTPHHAMHTTAIRVLLGAVAGADGAERQLASAVEEAASANHEAPCQFNWRGLLMGALLLARSGDDGGAARLEALAVAGAPGPARVASEPASLRLALLREDLPEVERLLGLDPGADMWDVDHDAARLDALAALGDRDRVETEAPAALRTGGYAAPFALRALAAVRGDRGLREEAAARFDALGLAWRAAETRAGR